MSGIPQLLSIAEAARALGVAEATLRDWRVDRINLAFVKVGDALRVDVREIERYITEHTEPPVAKNVAMESDGEGMADQDTRPKVVDFPR